MKTMNESTIIERIRSLWPRSKRTDDETLGFVRRLSRFPIDQVLAILEDVRYSTKWNDPSESVILEKLRGKVQRTPSESREAEPNVAKYRRIMAKDNPQMSGWSDRQVILAWWKQTLDGEQRLYGKPTAHSAEGMKADLAEVR